MSVKMREILADNLTRLGMVDPVLVVPTNKAKGAKARYRIVDGEHRYLAAVSAGYDTIPCVLVEEELSETEQKKQTIRLNQIKGQLSYEKFGALVKQLEDKYLLHEDALPFELGFEGAADLLMLTPASTKERKADKEGRPVAERGASSSYALAILIERCTTATDTALTFFAAEGEAYLILEFTETAAQIIKSIRNAITEEGHDFEVWLTEVVGGIREEL